ncbi:MAG: 50S ribosomal protein L17 [Candidatus Kerfeldbacteria bacterium]|nr:50S ribosomal protein L17 [Candidatus Kerfeldbacteria bacterium]
MRHRKNKVTLDRTADLRQSLIRNLVRSLILHEKITTTAAKGRVVRSQTERIVTVGKTPTLAHRRQLLSRLNDHEVVKKVLETLSPRYVKRAGGYTRAVKIGHRAGDAAEQVMIEFVS